MSKLEYFQNLIQEKRKKTPFRDFVKELGSWEILNLYKNNGLISRYPPDTGRVKIGNLEDFWETSSELGREYLLSISFFDNFRKLYSDVSFQPLISFGYKNENTDYTDAVFGAKNCYLSFVLGRNVENIIYSAYVAVNCVDIQSSFLVTDGSNNIYTSAGITNSYNIFYSKFITNSQNIWFSTNLIGCYECIGCDNIQNKKYCIDNIEYTQEDYEKRKIQFLKLKSKFLYFYEQVCKKNAINYGSLNIDGEYIIKSSNIENGYWINGLSNMRNGVIGFSDSGDCRNFYDCINFGITSSDMYGCVASGNQCENSYLSSQLDISSSIYYCYFIQGCHHCIGCIGLKNKSYCILNKQYTKEEWEILAEKIFASMEADGSLGEFFPATMNPFYFNDTLAYLIDDSFTKEEVEKDGYLWRDEPIKVDIPEGLDIVHSSELDEFQGFDEEGNWVINPKILEKVILDEKGNYYRIIKMEYEFLMRHGLPLPTIHWLERMKMGFSKINCFS